LIVTFIDPCLTATYNVPTTLPDVYLNYLGSKSDFIILSFQDSVSIATNISEFCGAWTYSW